MQQWCPVRPVSLKEPTTWLSCLIAAASLPAAAPVALEPNGVLMWWHSASSGSIMWVCVYTKEICQIFIINGSHFINRKPNQPQDVSGPTSSSDKEEVGLSWSLWCTLIIHWLTWAKHTEGMMWFGSMKHVFYVEECSRLIMALGLSAPFSHYKGCISSWQSWYFYKHYVEWLLDQQHDYSLPVIKHVVACTFSVKNVKTLYKICILVESCI